jgi:nitrate/nitrite transport system permease protein
MSLHPGLREVDLTIASTAPAAVYEPETFAAPAGQRLRQIASSIGWALVGLGVLVGIWAFGSSRVQDLPSPAETLSQMRELLSSPFHDNGPDDKGILLRLLISLQTVAFGFGLAAMVGIPMGLFIGASRRAWKAANPVIQLLRPVSPLAWFPVWLLVFKDAPQAAKWVIFMTALWPIIINTAAGASSIPADHRNVAKVFKFNKLSYVRHVMLPHTLPSIVTGMRLSMGVAWMVIVAVEMLSTSSGIGGYVWNAYNGSNIGNMLCAIILIGACGLLLDLLFLRISKSVALEEVKP